MTSRAPALMACEIAPDVFCLGPSGWTQTNVYFVRGGSSWVLVDAGWASDAPRIMRAAAAVFGLDSRPSSILLTHCHPDHSGGALELARAWDCPVYLHPEELPIALGDFVAMGACAGPLDRRVVLPIMRAMGRRRRDALLAKGSLAGFARTFEPWAGVPGLPGWECIPTPGHTPGHVSFFHPDCRTVITGDALVTVEMNSPVGLLTQRHGLSAPPWYTSWSMQTARESIGRLALLDPSVVAGGHGEPLTGNGIAATLRGFAASGQTPAVRSSSMR